MSIIIISVFNARFFAHFILYLKPWTRLRGLTAPTHALVWSLIPHLCFCASIRTRTLVLLPNIRVLIHHTFHVSPRIRCTSMLINDTISRYHRSIARSPRLRIEINGCSLFAYKFHSHGSPGGWLISIAKLSRMHS
jgi:hypothetical protein